MIITESQRNSQIKEIIAAVPDRQNEVLAWYFDEQIKKGNCRKMKDPKFAAQSFFALFFEYCISENMVSVSERKDSKEIAIQFVDLFLYGMVARHN